MHFKYCSVFFLFLFICFSSVYATAEYPLSKSDINTIVSNYIGKLKKIKDKPIPPVQVEKMLLSKAGKALKEDNFDKVINLCNKVIKKNPGSVLANKLLGISFFETNKIDKSKKFLDLALPGSKSDPLIANYLGNYFENKKDFKLAISFYYIANKNEKDIVSIEKIGKIYRKLKYYPEALIWFKKVKEIRPSEMIDYQTAITYFYLRELDFAKFILKKYIKTTTNPVIPALYAKILQMEKKYQETIDYLTKNRLEFDQKNLIIGISYYKLEKSKKAINYLKKYLKSKPDSYAAGMILSKLFISLKSFGKAIGVIEQLIGYHPKKYVINIIYSEALLAQNKIDEAIESYESAIEKTNNKNIKKELKELINELRMKQSNQANAKFVDTPLSSSFSAARTGQRSKRRRIISGDELARINAHLGAKFTKIYDKIIK